MILKNYETVFIMTPVLSEGQIRDTVKKYETFLKKLKFEIIHISKHEIKKLAYPIKKKNMGIYQVIEFKGFPSKINLLEKEYKLDENIIRYLTVYLDKFGIEYNKKKRAMPLLNEKEESTNNQNSKIEPVTKSENGDSFDKIKSETSKQTSS